MSATELFRINLEKQEEGSIEAKAYADASHPVYKGHFPSFPVTPGVCQAGLIQMVLEKALKCNLKISSSRYIKFLKMHDPGKVTELVVHISYIRKMEEIEVTACVFSGESIYLKIKTNYIEQ